MIDLKIFAISMSIVAFIAGAIAYFSELTFIAAAGLVAFAVLINGLIAAFED